MVEVTPEVPKEKIKGRHVLKYSQANNRQLRIANSAVNPRFTTIVIKIKRK